MRTPKAKFDRILLETEVWQSKRASRSKLENYRSAICNLRFNRKQSLTSIRKFLKSEGITTSTAAISKFIKSRFPPDLLEKERNKVAEYLEILKKGQENDSEKSSPVASSKPEKNASQKARKE